MADVKTEIKPKKQAKKEYIQTVGRRKSAVARVRLYDDAKQAIMWGEAEVKKGDIMINQQSFTQYFPSASEKSELQEPFRVTNTINKYTVTIQIVGGGRQGQLQAAVLGIARALADLDTKKFRPILKEKQFLTRDARIRERRKVGTGGKARRKKQSPKR